MNHTDICQYAAAKTLMPPSNPRTETEAPRNGTGRVAKEIRSDTTRIYNKQQELASVDARVIVQKSTIDAVVLSGSVCNSRTRARSPARDRCHQAMITAPPTPSGTSGVVGRKGLEFAVLVFGLAGLLGAFYYLWLGSARVDLEVSGSPIVNADEALQDAEALMREMAEADDAPLSDDASCHFGPVGPSVFCGPVWLGVSLEDRPWLQFNVSYTRVDEGVEAVVEPWADPTAADVLSFSRPDGASPSAVGDPTHPTTGRRTQRGSLILDESEVLEGVEAALASATAEAEENGVALGEGIRCFLREGPEILRGSIVTDDVVWCGPARTATSGADEVWVLSLIHI